MTVSPGHVLVVDDDDSIREVSTLALQLVGGWQVTTASDGLSALALAAENQPDVILLDVMMPGIDGLETLARLRSEPTTSGIPVVLMTAKASTGDEAEWRGLGVLGVIAKPFDPMTLGARLRDALEKPSSLG
ncbi:two-component system response regulator [Serinibacter arcticus]|uniref:Two-component system response regulator n=1 Tax=Serinibacter arcticus TaxID=1655435 RepID=A0A2U1ZX33_9MICO|nr:response regulator [Serinibacter arcticus]PWD51545.1 two-component system response regulator [Serinibacter arcticus]